MGWYFHLHSVKVINRFICIRKVRLYCVVDDEHASSLSRKPYRQSGSVLLRLRFPGDLQFKILTVEFLYVYLFSLETLGTYLQHFEEAVQTSGFGAILVHQNTSEVKKARVRVVLIQGDHLQRRIRIISNICRNKIKLVDDRYKYFRSGNSKFENLIPGNVILTGVEL